MAPEWRQVMGPRQRSARSEAGTGKPVARVGDSPPNYRRLFESGSHIALLAEIDRLKGIIKTLRVEVRTAQAASRQRGASTAAVAEAREKEQQIRREQGRLDKVEARLRELPSQQPAQRPQAAAAPPSAGTSPAPPPHGTASAGAAQAEAGLPAGAIQLAPTAPAPVAPPAGASQPAPTAPAVAAPVARMAPTGPTAPAPAAAADPAPAQLGAPTAEPECCICLDPNPSVVCVPCGHIVLCPGCVHLYVLQHHDCPLCRAPLDGVFDTSTARFTSFTTLAQPKRSFASALAAARPAGRAPA